MNRWGKIFWRQPSLIKEFQKSSDKLIFVVYGISPDFFEQLSVFRARFQKEQDNLYFILDMEFAKRDSQTETFFEIIQQLGDCLIRNINSLDSSKKEDIRKALELMPKFEEKVKDRMPEEKLAEFVRFTELYFFPLLKDICKEKQSIIIELNRFEKVAKWGIKIRNYILDRLIETLVKVKLRFVLFVQDADKPRLYYGSNEEFSSKEIKFFELLEKQHSINRFLAKLKNQLCDTLILRYFVIKYDVFLCHNSQDKPAVKAIGEQLKKRGLRPWLDEWEFRPGTDWQDTLEQQIKNIKSVAVFIGPGGMGPWQDLEQKAFIRQFVQRRCPVIPVILPDCRQSPDIPVFLQGLMWVDFRKKDPDPLEKLIQGITGKK